MPADSIIFIIGVIAVFAVAVGAIAYAQSTAKS